MKKILTIITTGFVPYGGLTSVMMNYWRAIEKAAVSIDFASYNDPPQSLLDELSAAGAKYHKLPQRKNLLSYAKEVKKISKAYDIVHVHGNSATSILELLPAKVAGVKKRIVHNHNSLTSHPILNVFLKPFFRKTYTEAIACSEKAGDWLFGKGQFKILKNAINMDRFLLDEAKRSEVRRHFGIAENDIVIGHVGKFNRQKNYPHIIKTFNEFLKLHRNSKLLLVAGGELESDVRKMVESLNLNNNVIFAGRRTDIPDMMNAMDVFLFPSLWEGLPLSVLEALSSGLPVFLSNSITKEICVSSNVYPLSLESSAEIWAKEISKKLDKKSRIEQIDENRKALTKAGFDIKMESKQLLKIYGA